MMIMVVVVSMNETLKIVFELRSIGKRKKERKRESASGNLKENVTS